MAEKIKFMMLRDYKLAEKLSPVFTEVLKERINQNRKWGEQNHPMLGTPIDPVIFGKDPWPSISVLKGTLENLKRRNKTKHKGWFDILLEKICEAFLESWPEKQREEMIQVAAVAIAIIECLDKKIKKESV
jgi:hypothetical protein